MIFVIEFSGHQRYKIITTDQIILLTGQQTMCSSSFIFTKINEDDTNLQQLGYHNKTDSFVDLFCDQTLIFFVDESVGSVTFGWRGPSIDDIGTCIAIEVLFRYLQVRDHSSDVTIS